MNATIADAATTELRCDTIADCVWEIREGVVSLWKCC